MKKKMTNKNYLTQQKLGDILSKHFDIESEVRIDGTMLRSDFKFNPEYLFVTFVFLKRILVFPKFFLL